MLALGIALFVLAIVFAWPIPAVLERFTLRVDPGTLIIYWQATGLAGGLSLIGATGFVALYPLSRRTQAEGLTVFHWVMLAVALCVLARLVWAIVVQYVTTVRRRKQHLAHVELLSSPSADSPATRILDSPDIVAYCISGKTPITVVSTGMLARLSDSAQSALLAHERAHLEYHHGLVVLPFAAWNRALPFVPATKLALRCITTLTEFMADDSARRDTSAKALAEALSACDNSTLTRARIARLEHDIQPPSHRFLAVVMSTIILLAPAIALVTVGEFL